MKSVRRKRHPTIGCCGIDCGLCPRFYTIGISKCPGCFGEDFENLHPSCAIANCCFKTKALETCADCGDFPCNKMKGWDAADSFVTHSASLQNLHNIRRSGIESFLKQQGQRMELLRDLLEKYDDGRSKSFFCLSAALLPTDLMGEAIAKANRPKTGIADKKERAKFLRNAFLEIASTKGVDLRYRKNRSGT